MNGPGGLDDLGAAGRAAWTWRVEERVAEVLSDLGLDSPHRFVLAAPDERTRHRTAVDWPGLPLRSRRMSDATPGPRAVGPDALRGRRAQTTELSDYRRQEKGGTAKNSSEIHRLVLL
jgi:hypothetical protein